jgi:hypothetical protein
VDAVLKRLILDDGTAVFYGKCLLATGELLGLVLISQVVDPNPFRCLKLLLNLSRLMFSHFGQYVESFPFFKFCLTSQHEDFKTLKNSLEGAKSVAIVGGGFLGRQVCVTHWLMQ